MQDDILPSDSLPPDTPIAVSDIVMKSMSNTREDRPRVDDLMMVLERAVSEMEASVFDIVLSYQDSVTMTSFVQQAFLSLTGQGYKVCMEVGDTNRAVPSSVAFVVYLSPEYLSDEKYMNELRTAVSQDRRVVLCITASNYEDWVPPAHEVVSLLPVLKGKAGSQDFVDFSTAALQDWTGDIPISQRALLSQDPNALPRLRALLLMADIPKSGLAGRALATGREIFRGKVDWRGEVPGASAKAAVDAAGGAKAESEEDVQQRIEQGYAQALKQKEDDKRVADAIALKLKKKEEEEKRIVKEQAATEKKKKKKKKKKKEEEEEEEKGWQPFFNWFRKEEEELGGSNVVDVTRKLRSMEGHTYTCRSVCVSPCGKYIVSGSDDKMVRVWSFEDGALVRTLQGHTSSCYSVCVSPCGKYIVSGSRDSTVRVWSFEDGALVRTLQGHTKACNSVCVSPCGKYIVSGSRDMTVLLWGP